MSYEILQDDTIEYICGKLVTNDYRYLSDYSFSISHKTIKLLNEETQCGYNSPITYYVTIDNIRYEVYGVDWYKILELNKNNKPSQVQEIFGGDA